VLCSVAGAGLAVAANWLVERYPQSDLLLWAALSGSLEAVIFATIWRVG
jgi:hypothetical protein